MWEIHSTAIVFMPARIIVEKCWNERETFHKSG